MQSRISCSYFQNHCTVLMRKWLSLSSRSPGFQPPGRVEPVKSAVRCSYAKLYYSVAVIGISSKRQRIYPNLLFFSIPKSAANTHLLRARFRMSILHRWLDGYAYAASLVFVTVFKVLIHNSETTQQLAILMNSTKIVLWRSERATQRMRHRR